MMNTGWPLATSSPKFVTYAGSTPQLSRNRSARGCTWCCVTFSSRATPQRCMLSSQCLVLTLSSTNVCALLVLPAALSPPPGTDNTQSAGARLEHDPLFTLPMLPVSRLRWTHHGLLLHWPAHACAVEVTNPTFVITPTCVRLYRLSAKAPSDSSRRCAAARARMAQGLLQRSSPLTRSHSARHCARSPSSEASNKALTDQSLDAPEHYQCPFAAAWAVVLPFTHRCAVAGCDWQQIMILA